MQNRPPPLFNGNNEELELLVDHADNAFVDTSEGFTCPPSSPMPASPEVVQAAPYTFWIPDQDPTPWLVQGELCVQQGCTPHRVAAKVIDNADMPSFLESEGRVLRILHNHPHPGLVGLRDTVSTKDRSFIVVDELQANLAACVHHRGRLSELDARRVFKQLVASVAHCHKHRIILQHLRPEKIFIGDLKRCSVVIADFDGAVISPPQGPLMVRHSAHVWPFSCPEAGRFCKSVSGVAIDAWALGVVLFFMLTGTYPYVDHSGRNDCRNNRVRFPDHVSPGARRLVSKLLDVEPKMRPSPATILEDSWVVAKPAESIMIRSNRDSVLTTSTFLGPCSTSLSFSLSPCLDIEHRIETDQIVPSVEPAKAQPTDGLSVERSVSDTIDQTHTTNSTSLSPNSLGSGWVKAMSNATKKRRAEPLTNEFIPTLRRRLSILAQM